MDKRVLKFLRQNFDKQTWKKLQAVYLSLCEIDSDFQEGGLSKPLIKLISTYSGYGEDSILQSLRILKEVGLVNYFQVRKKGRFSNFKLVLYEFLEESQPEKTGAREDGSPRKHAPVMEKTGIP